MTDIRTISADDNGTRLDRWVKRNYPSISQALLQKLLRKGAIKLDGKKVEANARLSEGQQLRMPEIEDRPKQEKRKVQASLEDARKYLLDNILYKDEHVLVLNKPAGLPSQGGSKVRLSVDAMLEHLTFGLPTKPKLVHRIDKDTSGILILARTSKAATLLTKYFKEKRIEKYYWAVVVGVPEPKQGKIALPLAAKKSDGKIEKSAVDEEEGKPAVTHYMVKEAASTTLAFVELNPVTGRMHQLRVHMEAIGHPILGDGKYGGKKAFIHGLSNSMHLHARRVVIPNFMGKKLEVTAPLPPHMQRTWQFFSFSA